jgi:hypothetical protein
VVDRAEPRRGHEQHRQAQRGDELGQQQRRRQGHQQAAGPLDQGGAIEPGGQGQKRRQRDRLAFERGRMVRRGRRHQTHAVVDDSVGAEPRHAADGRGVVVFDQTRLHWLPVAERRSGPRP